LYSYKTFSRNKDWQTNLTLFAKGVETCPNSYRTNITYAWESVLAGEKETNKEKKKIYLQNAVTYYQKGLAIYDKVDADWYNYGVSNSNLNNVEEALKAYRHALSINPKHLKSSYNLATIYLSRKDFSNSLKYFLMAYQSDSAFMDVPFKIGLNYHFTGDLNHAVFYYEKQLKLQPDNKDAISNLVLAYKSLENKEKEDFYLNKLKNIR
jgi:tetratricopeptide (TPR) repeat protein